MKWSILILTMPRRQELRERLMRVLKPQIEGHDDVEIKVFFSDPTKEVGDNRQLMMENAEGEYINFIDDDDLVSSEYVAKIYPLLDGVDYIGFPVHTYRDGFFYCAAYHSLKHKSWNSEKMYAERDLSHLNPIRRELALQAKMEGGFGEDHRWAARMRDLGIVKTEHYIPDVMYFYHMRSHKPEMMPA